VPGIGRLLRTGTGRRLTDSQASNFARLELVVVKAGA
jgi:hypothetical protein